MQSQSAEYYYHGDHLGSIAALSSADGSLAQSYRYSAYGKIRQQLTALEQPYTYTAREAIGDNDLYYYRSRTYSAATGRFLREDDWFKGVPEVGDELNWYAYVMCVALSLPKWNPVMFGDPWGYQGPGSPRPITPCNCGSGAQAGANLFGAIGIVAGGLAFIPPLSIPAGITSLAASGMSMYLSNLDPTYLISGHNIYNFY